MVIFLKKILFAKGREIILSIVNDIILKSEVEVIYAMSRYFLLVNVLKNFYYENNPNTNWDCFFSSKGIFK